MKKNEYSKTKIFKILNEFYLNKAKGHAYRTQGSIKIQTEAQRENN